MHDIFCFTDVHGCRPLFDAIMNYCNKQDPEATIIFLGDACDRGEDGYAIMKELLNNNHVIYLMGNHEDMFVKAAREIKEYFNFKNSTDEKIKQILTSCHYYDYKYTRIQDCLSNGGLQTLIDWIHDGMPLDIVERIENLPRTISYENMDFCHAAGVYETFIRGADAEHDGIKMDEYIAEDLIWSRSALHIGWAANRIAIFGHTPTPYFVEEVGKYLEPDSIKDNETAVPIKYYGKPLKESYTGAKIDMDTGMVFTDRGFVLNILTMKVQGFELENEIVKEIECIQL